MSEFMPLHPEGAPGQLQAVLGDAAFQQMLQGNEALQKALLASSEAALGRAKAVTGLINLVAVLVLLVALPTLVWLWRWALG